MPLQEANSSTDYSEKFDDLLGVLSTPPLFTVVRVNSLKSTVHDVCQQLQVNLYEVIIIIIIILIIIYFYYTFIKSFLPRCFFLFKSLCNCYYKF